MTFITDNDGIAANPVFVAEGQFWIPALAEFCGTIDPDDPTTVPDDALIAASLFEGACLSN